MIRKIYLLSQTHTDLGYTDHPVAVLMHHRDILDQALDLCEATRDAPEGAQHRWTCEVTSTTLDYLRNTTSRNVERFQALHRAGRISVGALRYHWTPLVSKPLAMQTLKDVDVLRDEFGVSVTAAMQCDVNGLAWFWNDLLVEKGVEFLVTQQNPHRGYWGRRVPSAWFWENRSGGRMLVLQGEHYGLGGFLRLSRKGEQDREELQKILARHAQSDCWPFDFSVLTVTNAANGDNVFPDRFLSDGVQDWNARENVPIEIITLDRLAEIINANSAGLPSYRGEWMDSWCDGVASSPLETSAARTAERMLPVIESLGGADAPEFRELVDTLARYDEHTWGAHSASTAPDNIFAAAQRTQKSNHAFNAFAMVLRQLAVTSRRRAARLGTAVEGDPGFDQFSHPTQTADEQSYLVANPADVTIDVDIPVPTDRGAGPQISIPQACGSNEFFPGLGEDGWTDALQDRAPDGHHRIRTRLAPAMATIVRPVLAGRNECSAGPDWIENRFTRLEFCPESGGLARWTDKASGRDVICRPTLVPLVQLLGRRFNRRQIFQAPYWEKSDTPMGWNRDDLFVDDASTRIRGEPSASAGEARFAMRFEFGSGICIESEWRLSGQSARPQLTAIQHARNLERAFSISWPIAAPGHDSRILLDTGDGWIDCAAGHVPSSSLGWQCMQDGLALAEHPDLHIVIASPDAPLFQPGGARYRYPHDRLGDINGGSFWTVNNHWDTNFPIRVLDPGPFRLSMSLAEAGRAREELRAMTTMPVIVRTPFLDEAPEVLNW